MIKKSRIKLGHKILVKQDDLIIHHHHHCLITTSELNNDSFLTVSGDSEITSLYIHIKVCYI